MFAEPAVGHQKNHRMYLELHCIHQVPLASRQRSEKTVHANASSCCAVNVNRQITTSLAKSIIVTCWQRWSPRGRPWPRGRPRGHIFKSLALALASKVKSLALALASKPQVLENWPVLGSRTALFFEQLKFRWKTPETLQKICEHLFCFPHLEHKRSQGEGGRGSAPFPIEISPMTKCDKKA